MTIERIIVCLFLCLKLKLSFNGLITHFNGICSPYRYCNTDFEHKIKIWSDINQK